MLRRSSHSLSRPPRPERRLMRASPRCRSPCARTASTTGTIDGLSGPQTGARRPRDPGAGEDQRRRRRRPRDAEGAREARPARASARGRSRPACEAGTSRRCSSGSRCEAFPSGTFDGRLRRSTPTRPSAASRSGSGLEPDGVAGPATTRALARAPATSPVSVVTAALRAVHRRLRAARRAHAHGRSTSPLRPGRRSSPRAPASSRSPAGSTATGTRSRSSTSSA